MKRNLLASAAIILGLALTATTRLTAAPEPAPIPPTGTWELTFKNFSPERFDTVENGKKVTYWYLRYTVTNNTGRAVLFTPDFELLTDSGQAAVAYKGVDRATYGKIKALWNSKLLESPFEILGRLLEGDDNARDGVAIWANIDGDARFFTILVQGLSNETTTTKNPLTGAEVVLQKTLQLDYKIPGQQIGIDPKPEFKGKKWVMK